MDYQWDGIIQITIPEFKYTLIHPLPHRRPLDRFKAPWGLPSLCRLSVTWVGNDCCYWLWMPIDFNQCCCEWNGYWIRRAEAGSSKICTMTVYVRCIDGERERGFIWQGAMQYLDLQSIGKRLNFLPETDHASDGMNVIFGELRSNEKEWLQSRHGSSS